MVTTNIAEVEGTGVIRLRDNSYLIYKDGSTYYATNKTTGITTSNSSFYTILSDTITALSSGGTILLGPGDFSLTSQLVITQNNIKIQGSGVDVTRILYDMASTTTAGFKVVGSIGSDKALTANAAKDQYVVVVGSTTGIAANDWCYLARNVDVDPSGGRDAELHQVASVTATDITFYNKLYAAYNTADSARVNKITWVTNFQLKDLTLYENRSSNTDVTEQADTLFLFCKDLRIRNVKFERQYFCSCGIQNCLDTMLDDVNCEFPRFLSGGGINYGVKAMSATTNLTINALQGNKCRHTFTTGIVGGSQSTTYGPGRQRNITISNSVSRNTNCADFDTHDGAIGVIFNGCGAIAGEPDAGLQTGTSAFNTRSPCIYNACWAEATYGTFGTVFLNAGPNVGTEDAPGGNSVIYNACEFRNPMTETSVEHIGIEIRGNRSAVKINNCIFHNINDKAIKIADDANHITIVGNTFTSCGANNSSSEGIIHCDADVTDLTVTNNDFAGTAPANSRPLVIVGTATGVNFSFNNVRALTNKDPLIPNSATFVIRSNNIGDPSTNTSRITPDIGKTGAWYSGAATEVDGFIIGRYSSVAVGTGTAGVTTLDSTGQYRTFDTGATINSLSGNRINFRSFRCDQNCYVKTAIYLDSISNVRIFVGFVATSSAPTSQADPLNALEGVGLWFDSAVNANWRRLHNNSSGASTSDDTTLPAATGTLYPLEIFAQDSNKFRFVFNNTATDISSEIPAATTNLGFWIYIENTTGASRTFRNYYMMFRNDK